MVISNMNNLNHIFDNYLKVIWEVSDKETIKIINYNKISCISDEKITIDFINIIGNNLIVTSLNDLEIIITGKVKEVIHIE